ncbi:MAG: hypothetical protein IT384_13645 [Deltaproteobacteria bacterium]|nr:hypothetical protein [Deltaproteobacteria bacterium]
MSGPGIDVILWTAATLAFVHTAIGVDHVVPFVALGRAQRWSLGRTLAITALCGIGHVGSSVILGFLGIGLGLAIEEIGALQAARGALAVWFMIGFGLAYAAWGVVRLARERTHGHPHHHASALTGWTLFILFVFGPCEALIPLMMAPAVGRDWLALAAVVGIFGSITVATMLVLVGLGHLGMQWARLARLERYVHVAAGLLIALSGAAVSVFGI